MHQLQSQTFLDKILSWQRWFICLFLWNVKNLLVCRKWSRTGLESSTKRGSERTGEDPENQFFSTSARGEHFGLIIWIGNLMSAMILSVLGVTGQDNRSKCPTRSWFVSQVSGEELWEETNKQEQVHVFFGLVDKSSIWWLGQCQTRMGISWSTDSNKVEIKHLNKKIHQGEHRGDCSKNPWGGAHEAAGSENSQCTQKEKGGQVADN